MQWKGIVLGSVVMSGLMLLGSAPAHAHHAFAAEFDATKPVKIEGTIVHVDSVGPDGQLQHWMFEGGGPYALIRRGFTKDYLQPSTKVVVEGFLSKGVPFRAHARSIKYPNGQMLFVGSSGTGAPADAKDPSAK